MLDALVNFTVRYLGQFGWYGVLIGMAIESCCIPLPSEVILPFGGFLAAQGRFSLTTAIVAGTAGGMLGSIVCYWLGMSLGREVILRYGRYVLIREHEFHAAEDWFNKNGEATVFIARLLPGVRTFISLPAGMARMNFARFFTYSLAGTLPWTLVLTWAGYKLGEHWDALRPWMHKADLVVGAGLVVLIAAFLYWRLKRRAT